VLGTSVLARTLWVGRPRGRSSSSCRIKNFSLPRVVQTGPGDYSTSYPTGTVASSPRGKNSFCLARLVSVHYILFIFLIFFSV
jgi:hypothetical protein